MSYVNLKTSSSQDARQLSQTLAQFNLSVAQMALYWAKFQTMVDNPAAPTNYTNLENFLGISAGEGANVWAIFAAANPLLTNVAVQNLQAAIG